MKRVRFYLRHPTDPERIDVVVVEAGAVLADTQATGKYSPLVSVSQLVKVELLDDAAERAVDNEGATVAPAPTPVPRSDLRTLPIDPVSVPTHVDPERPNDAA